MNHPHPDLPYPAKLAPKTLRIVALGGLGEIGRNMTVFEYEGQLLIVDCGVLFPDESQPGIDLILPDFSYIRDRLKDVVAVFLTHGHEDHIGALPFLLKERADIPVVASKLTLAFAEAKLKERRISAPLREVRAGMVEKFGPFTLEFIAVNHSIPDALAVAIKTEAGVVLATGDFKMDQLPLDGRITDLATFARLGTEGVDLFMTDSTNADVPGFTTSERDIIPALDRAFRATKRRVIVASFASHVHRIQQILTIAEAHDRKVAFVGRSMVRNMKLAQDLGYLTVPEGLVVDSKNIGDYGDQVVLICTGSQGEPLAALSRMANGEHEIKVGKGDTVVLASSLIPGNENPVYRVINELTRFGADVVHKGNAMVHVSGHAAAGELLYCYNILKPRNVMPVHGEYRHLIANGKLAEQTGVPSERVLITEDGWVIDLVDGVAEVVGAVECGLLFVDGKTVGKITEDDLKDRRVLAEEGFISIFCVVDENGRVKVGPEIRARAFAEDDHVFDAVKPMIERALAEAAGEGVRDTYALQQVIRRTIGTWVNKAHRRRPMIIPVVIQG